MNGRVLRAQHDILVRYKRIANLYIAYVNSDESPEVYGREFTIAVGEILEGKTLEQLELYHLNNPKVQEIASHGKKKGKRAYHRPELRRTEFGQIS